MKHECKFEEVIPRIDKNIETIQIKIDKALKFKYLLTGGAIAVTFLCGMLWKLMDLFI
jgi:hypothetical protein